MQASAFLARFSLATRPITINKMSKLLSIIIPLYNSSKWLPKCLDSILNQDVPSGDLEIVCIDDGSPDDSEQIALQYQTRYPNTFVVLHQENQGPSGARNTGMQQATGKYLAFVDPDDYVEPGVFGSLLNRMEEDNLDILRFNYRIVDEKDEPLEKREFECQFDYSPSFMTGAEFLANRLDIACNIWRYIYRTSLIVSNGIWCFTGDYFDDTPWLPIVLLKAKRMDVCDTVVYDYQERSDSLVKARTLPAVRKKIEGFFLLIHLLQEEMRGLKGGEIRYKNMRTLGALSMSESIREKVLCWYEMMIAHSVVSLLSDVAVYEYASYKLYLKRLQDLAVFPLSDYKASARNRRKIRLINTNPALMVGLVHYKNRK